MAKRIPNAFAGEIKGTVGEFVFYRRKGQPCIRRRPVRQKKFTAAEKKNQSRFGQASRYATSVLTDATQRNRYQQAAQGTQGTAQNLAVSDFMNAPTIVEIDPSGYTGKAGERIRARVEEGILSAAAVKVLIADHGKATLEQGAAVMEKDGKWWSYTAQEDLAADQALWITVTGIDQPGNRTVKTVRHTTGT